MDKSGLILFLLLWLSVSGTWAQTDEMQIKHIPSVTITRSNQDFFSDDHTVLSIRPDIMINRQENIGVLLEQKSAVLINTYGGDGSLVTVSMRGTGSNHTQLNWNGFPINSPATGQADLSLIPAAFMQSVDVVSGTSGALYGSGTFGGSINLVNEPDWQNRLTINYAMDAGSFGLFGNNLMVRTGNHRFQYHLAFLSGQSTNDFTYRDIYKYQSPRSISRHNRYKTLGAIQNVFLSLGNGNYMEGGLWYQQKSKEIPALMGSYTPSNAVEKDSVFRSYLAYRKTGSHSALVLQSAWFSDFLHYTDKQNKLDSLYSVNSRISSFRLMNIADYRYYFSNIFVIGIGLNADYVRGTSQNYRRNIYETDLAVHGNIKAKWHNWVFNAGIRKEIYREINPPLQYAFGLRLKVNRNLLLRSDFSTKFRKPTFNEKYWMPGGNPALRPEHGWGGEIGMEWQVNGGSPEKPSCRILVNTYFQHVDNWIQWVMQDSLTPVEYKQVHAIGFEGRMDFSLPLGDFIWSGFINGNYTRSIIVSTYDHNAYYSGKQLQYTPLFSGKSGMTLSYRGFTLGMNGIYNSSRETVASGDRFSSLSPYALVNLSAGITRKLFNLNAALFFGLDNLFNQSYQVIRSYPMPGREYHLTLTIDFNEFHNQD